MKKIIREWVELIGIATIVTLIWQGLELLLLKNVNPNIVDSVIGIPIVFLLHLEYKRYIRYID